MVSVGDRQQCKKCLLSIADAHATHVLHKFPFKAKQSLTHSCSNRFCSLWKGEDAFLPLLPVWVLFCILELARASWLNWQHQASTSFSPAATELLGEPGHTTFYLHGPDYNWMPWNAAGAARWRTTQPQTIVIPVGGVKSFLTSFCTRNLGILCTEFEVWEKGCITYEDWNLSSRLECWDELAARGLCSPAVGFQTQSLEKTLLGEWGALLTSAPGSQAPNGPLIAAGQLKLCGACSNVMHSSPHHCMDRTG